MITETDQFLVFHRFHLIYRFMQTGDDLKKKKKSHQQFIVQMTYIKHK